MRFRQFKMFELLSFHQQHLEQESRIKHDSETQESHKKLAGSVYETETESKNTYFEIENLFNCCTNTYNAYNTYNTYTTYTIPKHFSLTSTYMHNRYGYNLR